MIKVTALLLLLKRVVVITSSSHFTRFTCVVTHITIRVMLFCIKLYTINYVFVYFQVFSRPCFGLWYHWLVSECWCTTCITFPNCSSVIRYVYIGYSMFLCVFLTITKQIKGACALKNDCYFRRTLFMKTFITL